MKAQNNKETNNGLKNNALKILIIAGLLVSIAAVYAANVNSLSLPAPYAQWGWDNTAEGWSSNGAHGANYTRTNGFWRSIGGYDVGSPMGAMVGDSCQFDISADSICSHNGCTEWHINKIFSNGAYKITFDTKAVYTNYSGGLVFKVKNSNNEWQILMDKTVYGTAVISKEIIYNGDISQLRFEQYNNDPNYCNQEYVWVDNLVIKEYAEPEQISISGVWSDKSSYAPGERATIYIKVIDSDGTASTPEEGTLVSYRLTDLVTGVQEVYKCGSTESSTAKCISYATFNNITGSYQISLAKNEAGEWRVNVHASKSSAYAENNEYIFKVVDGDSPNLCTDTDFDYNIYLLGKTKGFAKNIFYQGKFLYGVQELKDYCYTDKPSNPSQSGNYLKEYLCYTDNDGKQYITFGDRYCNCVNGACVKPETVKDCKDSDGGRNPYVKGTAIGVYDGDVNSGYNFISEGIDVCSNDLVLEHTCKDGARYTAEWIKCAYGCSNGACLRNSSAYPKPNVEVSNIAWTEVRNKQYDIKVYYHNLGNESIAFDVSVLATGSRTITFPDAKMTLNPFESGSTTTRVTYTGSDFDTVGTKPITVKALVDGKVIGERTAYITLLPVINITGGYIKISAAWPDKPVYIIGDTVKIQAKVINEQGNPTAPEEGTKVSLSLVNTDGIFPAEQFIMEFNKNTSYYEYNLRGNLMTGKWRADIFAIKGASQMATSSITFKVLPLIDLPPSNATIQARVWTDKQTYLTGEKINVYSQVIDENGNTLTPSDGIKAEVKIYSLPTFVSEGNVQVKDNAERKCGATDEKCMGLIATYQLNYNKESKHYEQTARPLPKGAWHISLKVTQNGVLVAQDGDIFEVKTHAEDNETEAKCKIGCMKGSTCLPFGTRILNGAAKYCSIAQEWDVQQEKGAACQNNYECKSNQCSDGKCISLQDELKETQGMLQKVLAWFNRIFGSKKIEEQPTTPQATAQKQELVTAKLIKITGGNFVPSAGYYEGRLLLSDTATNKEYSIFACSQSWDWVKESACYKFNPAEVNKNIEQHRRSAELSGCYVGSLDEVSC